jgi:integrase
MRRSRYQSGSIFVRGKRNRMYIARFYENVIGPDGRLRRIRRCIVLGLVIEIGSRRAALARLAEILKPINLGVQKPKVMITFGEFVREQWKPKAFGLFKFSTQSGFDPLLSKHLLPYFGPWVLSDIKPGTVQGFLSEKTQSGVGWNILRNVRNLLSSILRTAVDWQYLEENPAAKAKLPPRPVRRSARHLLPDQVRKLVAEIPEPYRLMVIIAVLTGLRRGELFALRWGALDLMKGVLEVRESVYNGHFSTPKTRSSARRVPLSSTLLKLLLDRRASLKSAADEDLVFPSRNGSAYRPDNLLKRIIHPACDRLKIPRVGWHAFRHTHATQLSELGENPKTAQAILGHSDLETTMQTYTHAVPETMVRAEERLARSLLDLNGPKSETHVTPKKEKGVWIH